MISSDEIYTTTKSVSNILDKKRKLIIKDTIKAIKASSIWLQFYILIFIK